MKSNITTSFTIEQLFEIIENSKMQFIASNGGGKNLRCADLCADDLTGLIYFNLGRATVTKN